MNVMVETAISTTGQPAPEPRLDRQVRPVVLLGIGGFIVAGAWLLGLPYLAQLPGWITVGLAIGDYTDLRRSRDARRYAQRLLRRHEGNFYGRSLIRSQLLRNRRDWLVNAVFRDCHGQHFIYQARFKGRDLLEETQERIHEQEAGERIELIKAGQPSNLNEDFRDD